MIFKISNLHKFFFTYICPRFYGGSPPAPPSQTTQTVNQNSIPAELLPYTKSMMGAAENQVYTKNAAGAITGLQPYKPYSTNAQDYVAPFSPLQQQAQTSAGNLQTPGQFAPASTMAGIGGIGSMLAGQSYQNQATDPNALGAYMSPYMQNVMQQQGRELNRNYDISGAQQQGQATQAGAFGGSREALMASENERNRNMALNKLQAEGMQNAYTSATANQQFGATLGLQGMQAAGQAAGTLGNLGQQELDADTSIIGTQGQFGGQQQAQQQQAIDQAILDYKNAQQYPYMQLGTMSNLIRGIPMTNQTNTQYQAQPNMTQQALGAVGTGLGAYAALKAEGGVIQDKGYAKGGIVGYYGGGAVEEGMRNKLQKVDDPYLAGIVKKNESPEMTGLAKQEIIDRQAKPLAKGGIVAFAKEGAVNEMPSVQSDLEEQEALIQASINKQKAIKQEAGIKQGAAIIGSREDAIQAKINEQKGLSNGIVPENPVAVGETFKPMPSTEAGVGPVDTALTPLKFLTTESEKDKKDSTDYLAQVKEETKGIDAESAALRATQREEFMAERANAPDEKRRQLGLRAAEFFANWGSTPGPPLVAGMKAMREVIPSLGADRKEQKAMEHAVNKSLSELRMAEIADEKGDIKEGVRRRERAADAAAKEKENFVKYGVGALSQEQTLLSNERVSTQSNLTEITKSQIAAGAALSAAIAKNRAAMTKADDKMYTELVKVMAVTKPISGDKAEIEAWSKAYNTGAQAMQHLADKYGFTYETAATSAARKPVAQGPVTRGPISKRQQEFEDLYPDEEEED